MSWLQRYNKALVAFFALLFAVLAANGFDVPAETRDQIVNGILVLLGTFGVYQIPNKDA